MRNKFMVCALAALALCLAVSGAAYSASSASPAENWKVYLNARFGYSVEYPDIFSKSREPDNGDVKSRMDASLKLPESEQPGGAKPVDISAYALKNGRVYRGNTELDCEVFDVPAEVEGSVRRWSAFGTETSDTVPEAETGVWFFAEGGEALAFVPLESEYECQDVVFSPDGGKFVLVTGSGIRPDMFFNVYGEGTEKIAELSGIRGGIQWIDPHRFVFTRIDDTRDSVAPSGPAYRWRVSVVMYDAEAKEEIVLKEATDTQNYSLGEVIEDGCAVTVYEESVKSAEDWDDEEKIENREIRVEIPAAG